MEEVQYLRAFVAVHETRSFSAAAKVLKISQPTISRQVARLESLLSCQLFLRDTHRVIPTPRAHELARRVAPLLHDVHHVLQDAQELGQSLKGQLRIGCLPEVGHSIFLPLFLNFQKENPGVSLRVHYGRTNDILTGVLDGSFDFGITGRLPGGDNVLSFPLIEEEVVLVTRRENQHAPSHWKDSAPPFVMFRADSELVPTFISRYRRKLQIRTFNPMFVINSQQSMIEALKIADRFAVMPMHAVRKSLAAGELRLVIPDVLVQSIHLHHYSNPYLGTVAKSFKKYFLRDCRDL